MDLTNHIDRLAIINNRLELIAENELETCVGITFRQEEPLDRTHIHVYHVMGPVDSIEWLPQGHPRSDYEYNVVVGWWTDNITKFMALYRIKTDSELQRTDCIISLRSYQRPTAISSRYRP